MTIFLLLVLIFLQVVQLAFIFVHGRLLVRIHEDDRTRIQRLLESRGLIDLPIAPEPQSNYADLQRFSQQQSTDMRIINK